MELGTSEPPDIPGDSLYPRPVIRQGSPWRHLEAVEFATLEWVDWYDDRRLLEPVGNVPPAELEARFDTQTQESAVAT